jgi:transcriptional regulator with XRE-family HTH domain
VPVSQGIELILQSSKLSGITSENADWISAWLQREVAKQIGVTKCTIQYWETNRVAPALRFRPRVVNFLGNDAWGRSAPASVAERLRTHRERLGLSRKKFSALLGIDPSNIAGWEPEKHRPTKKSLNLIEAWFMLTDRLNGTVIEEHGADIKLPSRFQLHG